jgi:3-oxoacyl-[acyl-carrier-protein] synthase-3
MGGACEDVLRRADKTPDDIELVIPHQANLRIIEYVAKRANVPMDRVFVNVQRYGNMSAATVPVALCEALEQGRIKSGSLLLMPAFGAGLTFCAHLIRWGKRTQPIGVSSIELPPSPYSALELVQRYRHAKGHALT